MIATVHLRPRHLRSRQQISTLLPIIASEDQYDCKIVPVSGGRFDNFCYPPYFGIVISYLSEKLAA